MNTTGRNNRGENVENTFSNNENNDNNDNNENTISLTDNEDTVYNKLADGVYRGLIKPERLREVLTTKPFDALINEKDNRGETLLHIAVKAPIRGENPDNNIEIIKTLLDLGANPNIKDDYDFTPFWTFVDGWHRNVQLFGKDKVLDLFAYFLDHGGDAKVSRPMRYRSRRGYRDWNNSRRVTVSEKINTFSREPLNEPYEGLNMGFNEAKEMLNAYRRRAAAVKAYATIQGGTRRKVHIHKKHHTRTKKLMTRRAAKKSYKRLNRV